jgi:hypothetical protein
MGNVPLVLEEDLVMIKQRIEEMMADRPSIDGLEDLTRGPR